MGTAICYLIIGGSAVLAFFIFVVIGGASITGKMIDRFDQHDNSDSHRRNKKR